MSLPPFSGLPPQISRLEAVTPVAPVVGKDVDPTPLDIVVLTSEADWAREINTIREAATKAIVNAEVISVDNLEGRSEDDMLASLSKTIGALRDSGKINDSTILWVRLHGGIRPQPVHINTQTANVNPAIPATGGDGRGEDNTIAKPGTGAADTANQVGYRLVARRGTWQFSAASFVSALRHTSPSRDVPQTDFKGLIVWEACKGRKMAEILKTVGGENILLAGNKSMLSTDGEACILEVVDLVAARKREKLPPLNGRDYWMHLRNVSGEHIAYVQDDSIEIHKALGFGSSEPVLTSRTGRSADQPLRILKAKLVHGSPKAIQSVFDKYGKAHFSAVRQTSIYVLLSKDKDSNTERLREKMAVLEKNGYGFPSNIEELMDYLSCCTKISKPHMLEVLLQSQSEELERLLHAAMDRIAEDPSDSLPGLQKLLDEHKDIARQWFSVYKASMRPEIGRAIDRYLEHTVRDVERQDIEKRICLAKRDRCLANLLRNAFELNRDLAEAKSLMSFALPIGKPSRAYSYLNMLVNKAAVSRDTEVVDLLSSFRFLNSDYEDFKKSQGRFSTKHPWID